jgi:ribonuclease HII
MITPLARRLGVVALQNPGQGLKDKRPPAAGVSSPVRDAVPSLARHSKDEASLRARLNMTRHSLDELRQRYVIEGRPLEASLEEILRADSRAGARAILASIAKRRFENRSEGQRLRKMLRFETLLWDRGQDAIAGVDEAGMSPLAGPVSAAAVILKPGTRITGIDDSKKLDSISREALAKEIKEKAAAWCVAFVEVEEIDTINIYWAGLLAMRRAVEGLQLTPQHLLIDAKRLKEIAIPQQAIIKGDTKSASIAAASILAKVSRD